MAAQSRRAREGAGRDANSSVTEEGNEALQQELARDPAFAERWRRNANRRAIAMSLICVRQRAGLTQQQVAERAGWRQAHVARLESSQGPEPGLTTLHRFANACGEQAGVFFGHSDEAGTFHIDASVCLADGEFNTVGSPAEGTRTYRGEDDVTYEHKPK